MINDKLKILGDIYEKDVLSACEDFSELSRYLTKRELEICSPHRERIEICPYTFAKVQRIFNDLGISATIIVAEKECAPTSVEKTEARVANGKHYHIDQKKSKLDDR